MKEKKKVSLIEWFSMPLDERLKVELTDSSFIVLRWALAFQSAGALIGDDAIAEVYKRYIGR